MNGCCILLGRPHSPSGVPADALRPWDDRIIRNFYPSARCDAVVLTEAEEQQRKAFAAAQEASAAEEAKGRAEADRKAGRWPPSSREQCMSSLTSGDLRNRGVSVEDCITLASRTSATAAREGGYFVTGFGLWTVDSAGGVEPFATFVNPNPASNIKYIDLQIVMYNAVGDVIRSTIDNRSIGLVRMTGPLSNEDGAQQYQWEPVWYNRSAACVKIKSMRVEFMNRKVLNFANGALARVLHPSVKNECGVRRH
jgi:hypothetical protein